MRRTAPESGLGGQGHSQRARESAGTFSEVAFIWRKKAAEVSDGHVPAPGVWWSQADSSTRRRCEQFLRTQGLAGNAYGVRKTSRSGRPPEGAMATENQATPRLTPRHTPVPSHRARRRPTRRLQTVKGTQCLEPMTVSQTAGGQAPGLTRIRLRKTRVARGPAEGDSPLPAAW